MSGGENAGEGEPACANHSNPPNDHGTWVMERTGAKKSRQSVLKAEASLGRLALPRVIPNAALEADANARRFL
jgi:hypothetical protein